MTRDELDCSQPSIVFVYLRSLNARGGGGGGRGGGGAMVMSRELDASVKRRVCEQSNDELELFLS